VEQLVPNLSLRAAIVAWLEEHPDAHPAASAAGRRERP
jgi:hypothetical protein